MNVLNRDDFGKVLDYLKAPSDIDADYLFEVYSISCSNIEEAIESNILQYVPTVNHIEIIKYLLGEYIYSILPRNTEQINAFKNNQEYKESMGSVVADKYLSLLMYGINDKRLTSSYYPPVSSLEVYITLMLNIITKINYQDQISKLIGDLLYKSLTICDCSLKMLTNGYETEAFSCWRTLHECECTLICLASFGEKTILSYFKHMNYALAFQGGIKDKEETDKVFDQLKAELKQHDLKSKDMKKFIEYGWLYSIDEFSKNENNVYKLNFRDGIQQIAGLKRYSKVYELSSQIVHSTPMLIYSNKQYYYFITILNMYESFFRLESLFVPLFASRFDKTVLDRYVEMKKVYFSQLVAIHKRENEAFQNWRKRKEQ